MFESSLYELAVNPVTELIKRLFMILIWRN